MLREVISIALLPSIITGSRSMICTHKYPLIDMNIYIFCFILCRKLNIKSRSLQVSEVMVKRSHAARKSSWISYLQSRLSIMISKFKQYKHLSCGQNKSQVYIMDICIPVKQHFYSFFFSGHCQWITCSHKVQSQESKLKGIVYVYQV